MTKNVKQLVCFIYRVVLYEVFNFSPHFNICFVPLNMQEEQLYKKIRRKGKKIYEKELFRKKSIEDGIL